MLSIKLDEWQKKVLETKGNICLRSGRQVGKSTVISVKAGDYAIKNPRKNIMVISSVERQASLLFDKILNYIIAVNPLAIWQTGKERPTKHKIKLKNGSVIYCLPTGEDAHGIRGYTIDLLIADEAAFIPEAVWSAITPMLSTTKGNIILLSTPFGREGYFARCFTDKSYTPFHISSEDCERIDKVFLQHEKETMTRMQYAQEYLGEFVDELMQFFSDDLIRKCQLLKRKEISPRKDYFLGVDVARMGGDETAFTIIDRTDRKHLMQVESILRTQNRINDTTNEIVELDKIYHFKKIFIDDGGLGVGCFDYLLTLDQTKRKVIPINNARRSIEPDSFNNPKKTRLMKEDLYNNLLNLMERGEILFLDDPEIFMSLRSIQFEYTPKGDLKIFGRYTHACESIIRAAWCVKDKSLNLWVS
jgi:hypothetical protein